MFSAAKTAGPSGYNISRSVRLRSSASAYFSRTPASATNRRTWTWSGWVKRGSLGANQVLMSSDVGTSVNTWAEIGFTSADALQVTSYSGQRSTTAIYRDPSAWYHIVVAFDTTQAVEVDRVKFYVNGVLNAQTGDAGFPAQNTDYGINNNQAHSIGQRNWASGVGRYFDGYLAEVNFIDGQALTPSSFGETDSITGVWKPKKYTGTYGTNGFYLNFSDNSAATAAAIGKDYSGNGNNWTPNNISVTAGTTYDSMIDTPTPYADGSTGRGNYAVINPLSTIAFPVTNGNLSIGASTTANRCSKSSIAVSSGKWYWEFKASAISASGQIAGVCSADALFNGGTVSSGYEVGYYSVNGNKYVNGTGSAYGASWTTTDTIGVALDVDGGTVTFYKNNVSQGAISITAGQTWVADWTGQNVGDSVDFTFGQRPFSYTPPSGFKALNTYNLPASTILNGGKYMAATTYTGTGASQSVTNAGSFKPDLVWIKSRSTVGDTEAYDSVRGATKYLLTDSTVAEGTIAQSLTAFNSNGFALGTGSGANDNTNGTTYIGWQWQAGQGSTSSNTSGTITSTVSVNATAGFSVVTWVMPATVNSTVGHGLGVAPSLVILKSRAVSSGWATYHKSLGAGSYVSLNTTTAATVDANAWNNTAPTSSVFSIGSSFNGLAGNYVAYCWAEIAGFSKFGSYPGNGSADGPFVYCGFRPRWVMVKDITVSPTNWTILDTSRDTYNVEQNYLAANTSSAEGATTAWDGLSNGFKLRSAGTPWNASGSTMIFAAFAENPFANALAR